MKVTHARASAQLRNAPDRCGLRRHPVLLRGDRSGVHSAWSSPSFLVIASPRCWYVVRFWA